MTASLYDQAIPPFYLQERFTTASGDSAKRLHYLVSHLNLDGTNIENWKLLVQSASATIPQSSLYRLFHEPMKLQ